MNGPDNFCATRHFAVDGIGNEDDGNILHVYVDEMDVELNPSSYLCNLSPGTKSFVIVVCLLFSNRACSLHSKRSGLNRSHVRIRL